MAVGRVVVVVGVGQFWLHVVSRHHRVVRSIGTDHLHRGLAPAPAPDDGAEDDEGAEDERRDEHEFDEAEALASESPKSHVPLLVLRHKNVPGFF